MIPAWESDMQHLAGEEMQLFGASPDAIAVFPGGKLEVVEVKNHAPFREGGTTWKSSSRGQRLTVSDPGCPELEVQSSCPSITERLWCRPVQRDRSMAYSATSARNALPR